MKCVSVREDEEHEKKNTVIYKRSKRGKGEGERKCVKYDFYYFYLLSLASNLITLSGTFLPFPHLPLLLPPSLHFFSSLPLPSLLLLLLPSSSIPSPPNLTMDPSQEGNGDRVSGALIPQSSLSLDQIVR